MEKKLGKLIVGKDGIEIDQFTLMMEGLSSINSELAALKNDIRFLQGTIIAIERFNSADNKIFHIDAAGSKIAFFLPQGNTDFIQREIIRNGIFYQNKHLHFLTSSGVLKPGQKVLDVGANIGNHSLYFALIAKAAEVTAFEPSPALGEIFRVNMALNGAKVVKLEACAIGSKPGMIRLEQRNPFNSGGSCAVLAGDGDIPIRTLDSVVDGPVDFIKIDVEGMLGDVIGGADRLISQNRPILFVEATSAERAALSRCQERWGYEIRRSFGTDHLLVPSGSKA